MQPEVPQRQHSEANLEQNYPYASLVVARTRNFEQVTRRLSRDGIHCQVETLFNKYSFRAAKKTAICYHLQPYQDLYQTITLNGDKYNFDGQLLLTISITNYLKVINQSQNAEFMTNDDFETLKAWMTEEFPLERMCFYEFTNEHEQKEFYLKTESKKSTLFLYYILNSFDEKAKFVDPRNLNRMSNEERAARLRLRYDSQSQQEVIGLMRERQSQRSQEQSMN